MKEKKEIIIINYVYLLDLLHLNQFIVLLLLLFKYEQNVLLYY